MSMYAPPTKERNWWNLVVTLGTGPARRKSNTYIYANKGLYHNIYEVLEQDNIECQFGKRCSASKW